MKIKITPSSARGKVWAPPSKSVAHRLLISALLADGESVIAPLSFSEDIMATIDAVNALGGQVRRENETVIVRGGIDNGRGDATINCRESGSTLRFMIPICLLTGRKITLCGTEKLFSRPLSVYEDICAANGFLFEKGKDSVTVCGNLKAGKYSIRGDISSQFITGLMFALPLVEGDSEIIVSGKKESVSYIDITIDALKTFGVEIKTCDDRYLISGGQKYSPCRATVEADESNAAFLDAFGLFGNVEVLGRSPTTKQGDRVYKELFGKLKAGTPTIDVSDCPDLAPVLIALAAVFNGATFENTSRLALKESDRGNAMAEEMAKFGAKIQVNENSIVVCKTELRAPSSELSSHNDHRIAMALAVAASIFGGTIDGAEAVRKSYPDFFETIIKLGINAYEIK